LSSAEEATVIRLSLHPHRQREPLGLPLAKPRGPQGPMGVEAEPREPTDWPLGRPVLPASRRAGGKPGW
jgi:hypothetical protein